ncbi:MAG: T9SS type A sorting domain-containing protein [Flavobacteriales bacterium]
MGQACFRIILFTFSLAIRSIAFAQYNLGFEESTDLPFNKNGSLRIPTVGGFTNPQFSEIDFNGDGTLDLFVFDRGNDTWRTFVYNPSSQQYDYVPEFEKSFPKDLEEMALLRDYDCDGHSDVFTYHDGGFRVYRNNGNFPPGFELASNKLQTKYGSIITSTYLLPGDLPAITDVDNDGDLDILAFGNGDSENSIVWHRNTSTDDFATCDSLIFVAETECWGNIQEPPNSNLLIGYFCDQAITIQASNRMHPGSSVTLIDVDGDNDKDLVVGDIQTEELVVAINVGSALNAQIDTQQQSTQFPNAANPSHFQYMLGAYEIDANHDGKQDVIVAPNNNIDSSCNVEQAWLYENSATIGTAYQLTTDAFLSGEMLDLGTGSVPVYFDANGDGLLDLLVATDFYRSPTTNTKSRIHYFRNYGTAANPSFIHENGDYADLSSLHLNAASPTLGDLDGDGDFDMIIGVADGSLHYFENIPNGSVANFSLVEANYMGINSIGQNASPELADLNGDGLLDLIVGERSGTILYFENIGSSAAANFSPIPTNAALGSIDVSYYCCIGHASPRLIENEVAFGQGKFLFVGSSENQIYIYRVSESLSDPFPLVDSIFVLADRIVPAIADVNNNEISDLLCGTGEGGLKFYDRQENIHVGIVDEHSQPDNEVAIYPNPALDQFSLALENKTTAQLFIHDLQGQLLKSELVSGTRTVSITSISSGTYLVTLTLEHETFRQKLIIVK